jgi:hypothetical protein
MLIGERIPQLPQSAGLAWFDSAPAFVAWRREATDFIGMSERGLPFVGSLIV